MQALKPQSPARIAWETDLTQWIEVHCDCTTSDAQAIIEAVADMVDDLFARRVSTAQAAKHVLQLEDQPGLF
jgi:hypothetical protein